MKIRTKDLQNKHQWTAFTTFRGMDMYELHDTEAGAIINLLNRIR